MGTFLQFLVVNMLKQGEVVGVSSDLLKVIVQMDLYYMCSCKYKGMLCCA
jgi:hypothetical protein